MSSGVVGAAGLALVTSLVAASGIPARAAAPAAAPSSASSTTGPPRSADLSRARALVTQQARAAGAALGLEAGPAMCPAEVKAQPVLRFQCIASFEGVNAPYLVTVDGAGMRAELTHAVIATARLRGADGRPARCGPGTPKVVVQAVGSRLRCGALTFRVLGVDGRVALDPAGV